MHILGCNQKLTKLILCSWAFVFVFASVFVFALVFAFVLVFVFVILGPLSSRHLLKNAQSLYNDDTTSRSWPFQITFGHFFENSQSNEDFLNAKWQLSAWRPCLRMKSELSSLFLLSLESPWLFSIQCPFRVVRRSKSY